MSQVKESSSVGAESAESPSRPRRSKGKSHEGAAGRIDLTGEYAVPIGSGENALYIGIDLGTSRTSVSAGNGSRHTVLSCVGYCRDVIGHKRLGKQILVGQEAIDNRLALDVVHPLRNGVMLNAAPDRNHLRKSECCRLQPGSFPGRGRPPLNPAACRWK